jgi:hypothetical protein
MGISFHRGPAGETGRGFNYQGLREMDEGALGMERFSLEGLWRGLLNGDPGKYVKKGL